jgi:hypothetical protein
LLHHSLPTFHYTRPGSAVGVTKKSRGSVEK